MTDKSIEAIQARRALRDPESLGFAEDWPVNMREVMRTLIKQVHECEADLTTALDDNERMSNVLNTMHRVNRELETTVRTAAGGGGLTSPFIQRATDD